MTTSLSPLTVGQLIDQTNEILARSEIKYNHSSATSIVSLFPIELPGGFHYDTKRNDLLITYGYSFRGVCALYLKIRTKKVGKGYGSRMMVKSIELDSEVYSERTLSERLSADVYEVFGSAVMQDIENRASKVKRDEENENAYQAKLLSLGITEEQLKEVAKLYNGTKRYRL